MNTYTVMAGGGVGEFLWRKDETESRLVGANVYSQMDDVYSEDDCDELIMSYSLFKTFCDWAQKYMDGQPNDWEMPWEIEWQGFNAEGVELARQLKKELGTTANVQYVRADEDPGRDRNPVMLFLSANCG